MALGRRRKWAEAEYEALLSAHGFATQPAEPEAWRWCAARGGLAAGVGGYTCGLWLLFHATLASSDRVSAAPALRAIAAWVQDFFGCAECARHFGQFYSAHAGAHTAGHIDSSVWLWRAHNAVSLRLRASDADAAPYKRLWPAVESCKECYTEEATLTLTLTPTLTLTQGARAALLELERALQPTLSRADPAWLTPPATIASTPGEAQADGGPRGAWLRRCRAGATPSELAELLLSLEAKVRRP